MEMLKVMSETLRIGLVVSDMFVPGCPLAYLNEGFAAQTGTTLEILNTSFVVVLRMNRTYMSMENIS